MTAKLCHTINSTAMKDESSARKLAAVILAGFGMKK
jgi:hypothetical protein